MSALRIASGIQAVVGGEIFGIDTESRRMLHYASDFRFRHIEFGAPFGSLDYLAVLKHCKAKGASVIIVDSMSHEHEGPGGLLEFQAAELDRLTKGDAKNRDRYNMLAWQKPKAARRALINGLLQLNANFVFCFRAREKTKPLRNKDRDGKTEIIELGFMPIAGEEFLFEMTANCLLMPKSNGIPTWESEHIGEKGVMKFPAYLTAVFPPGEQLSEDTGRRLAEWAGGGTAGVAPAPRPPASGSVAPAPLEPRPTESYWDEVGAYIRGASDAKTLGQWYNAPAQKQARKAAGWTQTLLDQMRARVEARVRELVAAVQAAAPQPTSPEALVDDDLDDRWIEAQDEQREPGQEG